MATLDSQILLFQNDIYLRANVLPQYVDGSLTAYDLLLNSQLFQNITSMFIQSIPTTITNQYEIDTISQAFYDTPQLWYIILMMNGIMNIDSLQPQTTVYIPSPVFTQSYISESVSALKQTTPIENTPDLSTILTLTGVSSQTNISTTFIEGLITEALV